MPCLSRALEVDVLAPQLPTSSNGYSLFSRMVYGRQQTGQTRHSTQHSAFINDAATSAWRGWNRLLRAHNSLYNFED